MRYLIALLLINVSIKSFGQVDLPKDYSSSTAIISFLKGDSFGSGLFFTDTSGIYIVTAKHVIQDRIESILKGKDLTIVRDKLIVSMYTRNAFGIDSVSKEFIKIDVTRFHQLGLIRFHKEQDIAVLKIASYSNSSYHYYVGQEWSNTSAYMNIISYKEVNVGYFKDIKVTRDVFIFGYPKTIGLERKPQYDFDAPLVQKGIVAAKNYNNSTFILNCLVYGGNSGSPVVQVNGTNNALKLIGIITEKIPYIDKETMIESNSGYSVAVPIEHALSLMN